MEVTLGQTVHKKSVVPLGLSSTRSLPTLPLDFFSRKVISMFLLAVTRSHPNVFLGVHRPHTSAKMRPGWSSPC